MSDLSMKDIKKAYFSSKSAPTSVSLCYSGKTVLVRQLKIKDKKEFLKVIEQQDAVVIDAFIDKLIGSYVESDGGTPIDPLSLVDQERHQLLMMLRKNATASPVCLIDHQCPACKAIKNDIEINFDSFKVLPIDKTKADNLISTDSGVSFLVEHLNRKEMIEVAEYITKNNITAVTEKEFIHTASSVKEIHVSLDDVVRKHIPTIDERVDFVNNMKFDDFDKIMSYLSKIGGFGLDLSFEFKCDSCNYENKSEEARLLHFFIK